MFLKDIGIGKKYRCSSNNSVFILKSFIKIFDEAAFVNLDCIRNNSNKRYLLSVRPLSNFMMYFEPIYEVEGFEV